MQRAQTTDTHSLSRHSSRKYQNPRLAQTERYRLQARLHNNARGAAPARGPAARLSDPTCVLVPGRHNNETRAGAGGPFPRRSNERGGTIHTTQRQRRVGQSHGLAPRAFAALAGPLLPTRAMGPFLRLLTTLTLRAQWLLALPPRSTPIRGCAALAPHRRATVATPTGVAGAAARPCRDWNRHPPAETRPKRACASRCVSAALAA